jgi:phage protein D
VLICRYVGFPLILDKCPYLKSKVCVALANEKLQRNSALGDASGNQVQGPILQPPRSYKEWALQLKQKEDNAGNVAKESDKNEDENENGEEKKGKKGRPLGHKAALSTPSTPSAAASNPLSCASRHWARACRAAMLLEWRRGACAEWRVVNELMSSDRVTKVSHSKKEICGKRNKSQHIDEYNPLIATKLYVDPVCVAMFIF